MGGAGEVVVVGVVVVSGIEYLVSTLGQSRGFWHMETR